MTISKGRVAGIALQQLVSALVAFVFSGSAALAAPVDGRVAAGAAEISAGGGTTRVQQSSARAVINWREFGIQADERVVFQQPDARSATLNRVTGDQVSVLLGRLDANGQVLLANPNGVIIGRGAEINVGSFIATTANIQDQNFMAGRLVFDEPGEPGATVSNEGLISAAEGGLVALVAPHVRNDGLIQARLGTVALGAGDTFTIDLYGDGLINLALDEAAARELVDVSMAGTIDAGAGEVVLMTADTAGAVVDSLINLSGTVLASSVSEQGGRILLAGAGADITVSGRLDASGGAGGGEVHIGGDWQGGGDTPRAGTTTVTGSIDASATDSGDGGEVVLWSDYTTRFSGSILARGGEHGGDGGAVEVSGRLSLDFSGFVDASAPAGQHGLLLLDPAILTVGLADAALISRVLATGTSTSLSASDTININAVIDGRGKAAGGGLTLTAGSDININDFIITNNGALNFTASAGSISIAPGKALFSGSAPITLTAGGDLTTGPMITSAALNLRSTGGNITVASPIDAAVRDVMIRAALALTVNEPMANFSNGSDLDLIADSGDITINAVLDGRGGAVGPGPLTLSAGGNILLNEDLITDGGALTLNAGGGFSATGGALLYADDGPISVTADGDIHTPLMLTSGLLSVESTAGSIFVDSAIGDFNGTVDMVAANNLIVNQVLVNFLNGSDLTLTATGGDLTVNAQIDGRDADALAASGLLTLSAGGDVVLNAPLVTENSALSVNAGGALLRNGGSGLFAGNGDITVISGASLNTGVVATTGNLTMHSMTGALTVDLGIDETLGDVDLRGFTNVEVDSGIANIRTGNDLILTADTGYINVDARIDAQDDAATAAVPVAGGSVTLNAGNDVNVNETITTYDGAVSVTATNGTLNIAASDAVERNKKIITGSGDIDITVGGNFTTGTAPPDGLLLDPIDVADRFDEVAINAWITDQLKPWVTLSTTGLLTIESTGGDLSVDAPLPYTTGGLNLTAFDLLTVNQFTVTDSQPISLTAGAGGIIVNERPSVTLNDTDGSPVSVFQTVTVDAQQADLTLFAAGNVVLGGSGIASAGGTLSVTSTAGSIIGGIGNSTWGGSGTKRPGSLLLSAAQNIGEFSTPFDAGNAGSIVADAFGGFIRINVFAPGSLRLTTHTAAPDADPAPAAGDIFTGSFMGPDVQISAARDIDLAYAIGGAFDLSAQRDILLDSLIASQQLTAVAGNDLIDEFTWAPFDSVADPFPEASIFVNSSATTTLTASNGSVLFQNDASILSSEGSDILVSAGDSVVLNKVQTIGGVDVTATNGSITLNETLGATLTYLEVADDPTDAYPDPFPLPVQEPIDPDDLGLAYLTLQATGSGGAITMAGARAAGLIDIDTSGLLTSSKAILSTSLATPTPLTIDADGGTDGVVVNAGAFSFAGTSFGLIAVGTQPQLFEPGPVTPGIPPGPQVAPPAPPPAISALAPTGPGFVGAGATSPPGPVSIPPGPQSPTGSAGATLTGNQDSVLNATDDFGEIIPQEEGEADGSGESSGGDDTLLISASDPTGIEPALVFEGGTGDAAGADLGQSGSYAVSAPPAGGSDSGEADCEDEDCEQ